MPSAFFNPTTLLLEFPENTESQNISSEEEISEFLHGKSEAELAHELNHLLQFSSTHFGLASIRHFFDKLTLKLELIKELVRQNKGILKLPIEYSLSSSQHDKARDILLTLRDFVNLEKSVYGEENAKFDLKQADFCGGGNIARNGRPATVEMTNESSKAQVQEHGLERVFVRNPFDAQGWRMVGALHILEGASFAIDMMISRHRNLPGRLHASHPWDLFRKVEPEETELFWDPYLIANSVHFWVANKGVPERIRANLEELFLLSETALMHDNSVQFCEDLYKDEHDALSRLKQLRQINFLSPYKPQNWFLGYCMAIGRQRVQRLPFKYDSGEVSELTDALIRLGGVYDGQTAANQQLKRFVGLAFSGGFSNGLLSTSSETALAELFSRSVGLRSALEEYGGVFGILKDGKERLVDVFHHIAPGLKIGGHYVSKTLSADHEGIGSALSFVESLDETTEQMIFGTDEVAPDGRPVGFSAHDNVLESLAKLGVQNYHLVGLNER